MIVHIEYYEYKTKVISKLNERVKDLSKSVHTVWDHENFVKYCHENYDNTSREIEKCSIGLQMYIEESNEPGTYDSNIINSFSDLYMAATERLVNRENMRKSLNGLFGSLR